MRISLRHQILLWYAVAVTIIIMALVFVAQQVMVASLRAAVDERLQYRTQVVAAAIINNVPKTSSEASDLIEAVSEQQFPYVPTILRISDPKHEVLATFGEVPEPMVPILNRQLLLPETAEGRFETIRIRGQDALRLYTVPVHNPATTETVALVQTGDSLASLVVAQEQLWRYTLTVGIAGSLVAILVGFFIVRRGFRPLEMMLNRVQSIETGSLGEGLPEEPRPPELQQLAGTLNSMMQRLDTAFKAREAFFAGVSHDLKTPLTVLQGQIDILMMQPSMDEETRRSLESMGREVRRLIRMSNNLLLNAQLASNPVLVPGEVNLRELLDETVREMRVLAIGLKLEVSTPEDVFVPGDYDLLKQMVLNVVDNAVKFTPKGGSISLTLSRTEERAVIEVSDTGQGISPENLPNVTEPFYKASASRKAGAGGAGLGLSIVLKVIELHGGQLDIHSQEKIGTTVTMRLPQVFPL